MCAPYLVPVGLFLASCDANSVETRLAASAPSATLPGVTAAMLDIDRVVVRRAEGWEVLVDTPQSVDVLKLADQSFVLGDAGLPPGHYTEMRLMLGDHSTITVEGREEALVVPASSTAGIKLPLDLVVGERDDTTVIIGLDVGKSLARHDDGRWRLEPQVQVQALRADSPVERRRTPTM